jgi:uncharacterized protein YndB with AHSA1/START domain
VKPHVYQLFIRATAEQVWQAITDPEFTRQYFHGTSFTSTLQVGAPMRYVHDQLDAADGVIEVCEPPNRLVYTWRTLHDAAASEEPPSRVEWRVDPAGEGLTRLRVQHGDLARSPRTWGLVADGWVWILDGLKTLLETGASLPQQTVTFAETSGDVAADWHRAQGIECNNGCWEMLAAERSDDNDEELLRRAYASAYHWQRAAGRGPENEARALYMVSKALLATGQPDRALRAADRGLAQCAAYGLADFDLAYAHEARARALKALGRAGEAAASWDAALSVPIADPEDKAIIDGDFAVPL